MTNSIFRILVSALLSVIMGVTPLLANKNIDPSGLWQAEDGESRYEVTLCGDGTQLCAKLIWIRADVTTSRNKVYIDTYVVNGAKRYSFREWRGNISLYGHTVYGNVRLSGKNRLKVKGCALIVICVNKDLMRMATD